MEISINFYISTVTAPLSDSDWVEEVPLSDRASSLVSLLPALSLLAVAVDTKLLLINSGLGDKLVNKRTEELVGQEPDNSGYQAPTRVSQAVRWSEGEEGPAGTLVIIHHFKNIKQVTWHPRGDYFATVMPDGLNRSVMIHQLSKWRSMVPFSKPKGIVQSVLFHPIRPMLFVVTMRHVRIYDLVKQELTKVSQQIRREY